MSEVQVLQKTKIVPNGRNRGSTGALKIDRIRVAAYCRVSTDDDEQLGSFESQKLYYEQKIASNKDWVNTGIFADEAVTGTKTDKRSGFQDMIAHCNNGEIDMILTKSISRFARNTVDTLNYVRMLRDRNIAIFFEKENINTLDMNGELLLTIMSSLAQQEVESLSQNVKMGLQMKMKRGELIGFNGCYGYDYHTEDKSITVNEEEAEIVRMIYDMYLEGYGTTTIAKRLMELGIKNKKGEVSWHTHGVMGMIKNEKYKGDILLGKTFTTDPISKRRLANMGEENQYYLRDHHEPIVSRKIWDKAEEIRMKRSRNKVVETTGNRERYTCQYSFSSMCECAYCGHKLTRRTRHSRSDYEKPVWQCMNATKNGIANCPNCKAVDEAILEGAFLGSIAAGILAEKLKIHKLSVLLASMGIFIIPAGIVFILPVNAIIKYGVTVVSFCGMQAVISIFSIFAVSLIQQRTPNHLIGKVMAYTSTVTLCVQPIGQIVYGFLFDRFYSAIYFVLIPTGIIVCIVGLSAMNFFKNMEKEQQEVSA